MVVPINLRYEGGSMKCIDKALKYFELLMTVDNINSFDINDKLSDGYTYSFYNNEMDKVSWARIHISTGEFTSYKRAFEFFDMFYKGFENELSKRCIFIEYCGKKIATATISPSNEYGYNCVIDWLAISKDFQGKGLSKPLINKCISVAKKLNYNRILLHTQTHTWLAAKIYLDVGFEPYFVNSDYTGWSILKTLINHDKLANVECISKEEMYDNLYINIVNSLNSIHSDYSYEIWHKNNQNDVYVRENDIFYHYKFYNDGNEIILNDKYLDLM